MYAELVDPCGSVSSWFGEDLQDVVGFEERSRLTKDSINKVEIERVHLVAFGFDCLGVSCSLLCCWRGVVGMMIVV